MKSSHLPNTDSQWKKPLKFAIFAALGAGLFALLGELWLALTISPPPPPPPPQLPPRQAVVLVLDTSGSMEGSPFEELKRAALEYIERQDLKRTRIGIVSFNTTSHVETALTSDPAVLRQAIDSLYVDGVTRMDLGLQAGLSITPLTNPVGTVGQTTEPEQRSVLLFTDGYPEDADPSVDAVTPTREAANAVRKSQCRLVAIGTEGADGNFLEELTGEPNLVFAADSGQFGEAFKKAETAINAPQGRTLIQSDKQENFDASRELWRIAVWTGLLSVGVAGALLLSQSFYSHSPLGWREGLGLGAGLLAGLLAGAAGQAVFARTFEAPLIIDLGRTLGWALAGALIGVGISPVIPNLKLVRAGIGGLLGGWLGGWGFLIVARLVSDAPARVAGAAIVGFAIGLMVVLAEVAFREAWLRVSYGPGDAFDVTLGNEPVSVGNDSSKCRILGREIAPLEATYLLENGRALLEDRAGNRSELQAGDSRRYGNVEVTFCTDKNPVSNPKVVTTPAATQPLPEPPQVAAATSAPLPPPPSSRPVPPASVPQPKVVVVEGWYLQGLTRFNLPDKGNVTIGSDTGNTIVLSDPSVEAQHIKLTVGAKLLTVRDLRSQQGTFINGKRLEPNTPSLLRSGERLTIGRLNFILGRTP